MGTIIFFILGGALSVSTCVAFDQYRECEHLKKQLEDRDNNEQDLRTESNN